MIDAGLPLTQLQVALRHRLTNLDGVIITHSHGDHALAAAAIAARGVPILCQRETAEALDLPRAVLLRVNEENTFGQWRIIPVPVQHDVPNVALLIQAGGMTLFHATDAGTLPVRVDPDILALEVNHDEQSLRARVDAGDLLPVAAARITRNHLSIQRAVRWLESLPLTRVREVHLLHLSDSSSREREFIDAVEAVTGVPVYAARSA